MELSRTTRPVAPGAELTSFERLESDKWLRADALSLRLGSGKKGATADYLSSGKVSERKPVSELAKAHDPGKGRRTVAAFNADFFDINETGAPLGPGVRDGRPAHSPAPGTSEAVGVGPEAAGRVLDLYFEGTLTLPGGTVRLDGRDAANVPEDGIGLYDAQWGEADRELTVDQASDTTEVTVEDGKVTSVSEKPGKGPVPEGVTVLLGRGEGAERLAALHTGDPVSVEYRVRTDDGSPVPRTAVGGRGLLVVDGAAQDWEGRPNNPAAPRTAVGFSKDGGTMHVLTVDGRQASSGGVTLTELALMMKKLGAYNALNLDGGGSSTLLAREPGSDGLRLENSPSDGEQREVPNGLALTAPEGSGRLSGFRVKTATDPEKAPTADNVPGGHPERVFPGLTRKLTAAGYDETYGPATGAPRPGWVSTRPAVGRSDASGVFHAHRTGSTKVMARSGPAKGATELKVLGRLARVRPTTDRVGLQDSGATASFGLVGYDAQGNSAPVEPSDARLDYDRSHFEVTPDKDAATGAFTVKARPGQESASGVLTVTVDGRTTHLALTVGLREQKVADFDDASGWTFSAARATGSVTPEPSGKEGGGLKLGYDFTQSTATRAAYVNPPSARAVAGQPKSFTMWIRGDGSGAWPSLHLKDAVGTDQVLRGPVIDWRDWRQITFEVPDGVAYPLKLHRIYLAETRPTAQYTGEVVLDELVARTPPDVDLPPAGRPHDPLISTASDTAGRDWRFAVMSDAQFVARAPDSALVRQARRTLREIRAARPDFLVVNGDLVDEGSPEDLKFARKVLTEELGDAVDWYYVPGNHEVMGGSISNFVNEFGPARRTFDHRGTRFITLDTSSLTVRDGGYEQFRELRRQLDDAAKDSGVSSVAVIQHVPPRDPTAQQASRLTDRREADLLEDWLAGFRSRTGKGAVLVGSHVGVFDASRVDGVPYLVNGNSGKAPASPPDEGGFTGWSLLGIDAGRPPRDGDWISVQTRAHVDGLSMEAPARIRVGGRAEASATVTQGTGSDARRIPVDWPVSADWPGSPGLCVKGTVPRGRCVASYDPDSGTLSGNRPGKVTLSVTVNGTRAAREVTVAR
ncbi:phosphodiester glycosidase family protein [Streptomyces sp. NBC_01795]|uniref:phosphodiester glycosidase family protein n=1 Tax=unclassified Streptomyces TaxID=2593676 RepID=UPI002DD9C3CF|nr:MULTISPECIES: phosphodiester glycosidase family protein [unclassified Streptomyces]WSA95587.1 phosphodiester glycosidase family protein [Streptomyces sp. NBC_01795]WSS11788.1 phosphodiester glycosidase family protein [Streptomyces sp. NBC_01186]